MKLILAIVHNDDAPLITATLGKKGIPTTKIASTGGFLSSGNTTFLTGVDDERVEEVTEVIKNYSRKRTQPVAASYTPTIPTMGNVQSQSTVLVGGATIFVLNIESFTQV